MIFVLDRLACAARRWAGTLALLLATGYGGVCVAQLEALPSVPQAVDYAPTPMDQASPLVAQLTPPAPAATAEPVWTPYGEGSVSSAPGNETTMCEPCYDCPPTGFECCDDEHEFQLMPKSLIWHSYLAGPWEPRFASVWSHERTEGWVWDIALGGRVGICRWGSKDCAQPNGWEIQMEGAAFPRLDPESSVDLIATDYRFGAPLVYGNGRYQMKFGFYHVSSHLGDEYMVSHPGVERINFGRNALAWGHSYYVTPDLRLYGEIDWAWDCGSHCAPFVAMNCQLRQELDFGGNFVAQAGWAWRYGADRRMFRVGVQYYDGGNQQFEFYKTSEQKVGLGLWYDY
jgi:hypothetical protein